MNKRILLIGVVAACIGGATLCLLQRDPPVAAAMAPERPQHPTLAAEEIATTESATYTQPSPSPQGDGTLASDLFDDDPYSEDPAKMFRADSHGDLVLEERTRLNVEKLSVLYSPEEQQQRLGTIEATLPPSAYRQLVDLMQRYQNFSLAAKQAYRPDVAPTTLEEVAAQQEGLHALRVAHFGEETTEALYGREERTSRQLLEFMALEKHEGLTLDEKAQKAQEMFSRSPELAAAYQDNRTAPANDR